MTKAATYGTFSTLRIIKTRSVAVVEIEIPLERMNDALTALGGIPLPGKEPWVAVALLEKEPQPAKEPKATVVSMQAKERYQNADEMTQARTRAVMLCGDKDFQRFMEAADPVQAGVNLCAQIGILSRSAIGTMPEAHTRFRQIENAFRTWQQTSGHSPAVTGVQT